MGNPRRRLAGAARFLFLVVGSGLVAFPFVWMVLSSFKSSAEINLSPPTLLPLQWHLENYRYAWTAPHSTFGRYYLNSVVLATGGAALQTAAALLAAYAFGQMSFPGKRMLFIAFLGTMMIPAEVTLIPNFVTIRHIPFLGGNDWSGSGGHGLYDSYLGMILPSAGSAFSIFFLRQAFMSLPNDYWEAARLDGCGRLRYLWYIALPLVKPAAATMVVFAAFQYWNALLWPLVITNTEALRPVQVAILYFQSEVDSKFNLVMAAATLSMLPGLILYFLVQRQLTQALAFSGVKG